MTDECPSRGTMIVVTGSEGFLGQYVKRELYARGLVPSRFDHALGMDVRQADQVEEAMTGASGVIHLAGVLGTGELFDKPHRAIDVNVKGTLNVIQAATMHDAVMVGIEMPRVWPNVYQATKTCARTLMTAWHLNEGLRCSSVRAFNVYGPGQKVHGVQKIIPTFATKAWRGEPIPIWGDGKQMVDLVWAGDVARMLCDALKFGDDQTFDAGTGVGTTVLEVAEEVALAIHAHIGRAADLDWEFLPMRKGETPAPDLKAEGVGWDLLGWEPDHEPERFQETIEWYKEDRP